MFKPLHFITGLAALLLAIALAVTTQTAEGLLLLASLGLLHLFIAPLMPSPASSPSPRMQAFVSLLLIAAVIVAAAAVFQPGAGYELASLVVFAAATLVHLLQQRQPASQTAPRSSDTDSTDHNSPQAEGPREAGTVKWFNTTKGFGFISRDNGDDIFVHFRAIRGEGHRILSEGQRVEYSVISREKGLQAEDVVEI